MIYIELLWAFLKVGVFSFGGAHGSIPIIRDIVMSYGWISEEMFAYFVAVSESTPGPIMINLATYIGSTRAGLAGALLATAGVVLPSFFIILFIVAVMKNFIENKYVQSVLKGIRPCFIGILLATGLFMVAKSIAPASQAVKNAAPTNQVSKNLNWLGQIGFDWRALAIAALLLALSQGYQRAKKKDFSSILLILISAGMGVALYSF